MHNVYRRGAYLLACLEFFNRKVPLPSTAKLRKSREKQQVLWHSDAGYTYFGPAADPSKEDIRDEHSATLGICCSFGRFLTPILMNI